MRKVFVSLLLLGVCVVMFGQENKTVRITVHFRPAYGSGSMEIYNGSYQGVASMMNTLSKARRIPVLFVSKAALEEGEYNIEIFQNGSLIESYTVFNSQNIFDNINNKFLKSNILSEIHQMFVLYLLRDRYDPSL